MKSNFLVVGDSCEDRFIYCSCVRLSPEGPVPVLNPGRKTSNPGMAGNVALNLEHFGADALLLKNSDPIIKTRYIDEASGHYFLRVDENDRVNSPLTIDYLNSFLEIHSKDLSFFDCVYIADYGKGFLNETIMEYIFNHSRASIVDSKGIFGSWSDGATWIKINEKEYNYNISKSDYLARPSNQGRLIVTRAAKGTLYNGNIYPVDKIEVIQSSGAGDSFGASFITHWLSTGSAPEAIKFANKIATKACQMKGVVSNFD